MHGMKQYFNPSAQSYIFECDLFELYGVTLKFHFCPVSSKATFSVYDGPSLALNTNSPVKT